MDTKLSVVLLSGISLFMSIGAFAVAEDGSSEYINWSYAMGDTTVAVPTQPNIVQTNVTEADPRKCTVGCPSRPETDEDVPLTLTYEDEAAPIIERVGTFSAEDRYARPASPIIINRPIVEDYPVSQPLPRQEASVLNTPPRVSTQYIQTEPRVQYPVTRQYPISVQYPVTVQRNMTIEQPVIMQQPVIVRRPVVMQQEVTVQRQPTVIQHQPVVMQQQPTFLQQQPVFVQAPAQPINPSILAGLGGYAMQQQPMAPVFPWQPVDQAMTPMSLPAPTDGQPADQMTAPTNPTPQTAAQPMDLQPALPVQQLAQVPMAPAPGYMPVVGQPQQYQVQGQIQTQPVYAQPYAAQALQPVQAPVAQQPVYLTPTY